MARQKFTGRSPEMLVLDGERRKVALDLFKRGLRDETGAAEMRRLGHHCDRGTFRRLCKRAVADLWMPAAEEVKDREIARLEIARGRTERQLNRLEKLARVYLAEAVIEIDGELKPKDMDAAALAVKAELAFAKANESHIKNSESLRTLLGVDAPKKQDVTLKAGEATPANARRVMQELFGGNVGPVAAADGAEAGASDTGGPPAGTATH
jgi:hypothetical protein